MGVGDLGLGDLDVALVLIEQGKTHANRDTGGVFAGVEVITVGDPDLDIGDGFHLLALQGDLVAGDLGPGDLEFGAGVEQVGQGGVEVGDGSQCLQVTVQPS